LAAIGLIVLFPLGSRAQSSNDIQFPSGFSSESNSGGLSALTSGVSSGTPSVTVAQPVYDFGAVFQGTQVKHTFTVTNKGPGTLTIGPIMTSCGCTVAQPTKRQLQPGEISDIAAVFDTSSDKGPSQRLITVNTNDPQHKQLTLTMKGDVKLKVDANPLPVVFDKVKQGTETTRTVLVTDMVGAHSFKITSINRSSPDLKITQQPRTDGKAGAVLAITLLKTAPAGTVADTIKVATSESPLNIPVFGTILGDLNVNPAQVSFGIIKHHASAIRYARLTNTGNHAVKVLDVSSNNPRVAALVEPITPGREFKLTLQLQPNAPDGTLHGVVAIKTDDPAQPLVQVPFYGIVGTFSG
jgi:hypothetical protein